MCKGNESTIKPNYLERSKKNCPDSSQQRPGQPVPNNNIYYAVILWNSNTTAALAIYGDITTWQTGLITDMSCLFLNWRDGQTGDISAWDVSRVQHMDAMFEKVTFCVEHMINIIVFTKLNFGVV